MAEKKGTPQASSHPKKDPNQQDTHDSSAKRREKSGVDRPRPNGVGDEAPIFRRERAKTLTTVSAVGSAMISVALFACFRALKSDLALAQAADSLLDVAAAVVLAWAVRVAETPKDENHPMGHSRAEPLGALAIAVLAAILALEVGTKAVETLVAGPEVQPRWVLLAVFVVKMAFRGLLYLSARRGRGPAFEALTVDARNDAMVGAVAVIGFMAARFGATTVDAWLALPLAVWIGWSGVELAWDNIRLLMGEAPSARRQKELLRLAASAKGVLGAHDLRAQHLGTELQVHVHVTVPGYLTVREGHDIGEGVRTLLEAQEDVGHCSVHIDPHTDEPADALSHAEALDGRAQSKLP